MLQKNTARRCCVLAAALGALVFLVVYGPRTLDVTYDAWILNGYIETDITQRYAGWLAYRQAENFFPLTWSPLICFPAGGYTSLTDSIPLAEVFFKLLSPLLPTPFQYCGWLCLLDLALQGACGALLLGLFFDRPAPALLGAAVFCFSPVLLERLFRHTSLSFHWLLLLAIWLYFKGRRVPGAGVAGGFCALAVLSVWLHLYFTPMILGFFLAYLLGVLPALSRKKAAAQAGLFVLAVAGALGSAKLLGLLDIGLGNTSGYGTMGMNLNALFNPVSLDTDWWVPGKGLLHWSRLLPVRALANNNLESFNYLGLGVLAGGLALGGWLAVRLLRTPKETLSTVGGLLRRHLWLALFAGFSTLFAISHVVCAFSYVLFTVPLPAFVLRVCNAFRASGRLFWSVNYLLVTALLVAVGRARWRGRAVGAALLAVLLTVQVADMSGLLAQKHSRFSAPETFYAAENVQAVRALNKDAQLVFFLELREERPLGTALLREGVATNLLLISRDGYGVAAADRAIVQAVEGLLAGAPPYQNAIYATGDEALCQSILAANPGWHAEEIGGLWYATR